VAQAEAAADAAALALWWAGCFPEWVERGGTGQGMVRAYVTFRRPHARARRPISARSIRSRGSGALRARRRTRALSCTRRSSKRAPTNIGDDPHSSESRLNRFLRRLADN